MSRRIEDSLKDLKTLPTLEPPANLESTTLAAMASAAAATRPSSVDHRFARAAGWIAVIGLGALLTLSSLNIDDPVAPAPATASSDETLYRLAEQSMLLEEVLAALPESRRVMRADTASTIVGLEDRIALIDAALYSAEVDAGPAEYREALMRDRVEMMNALVNVRYAQSRAFIF